MTQEQFNRAMELKEKLDGLKEAKKEIETKSSHRLSYLERSDGEWRAVYVGRLGGIGEILDRHDKQIRKEIDEEIAHIGEEIARL